MKSVNRYGIAIKQKDGNYTFTFKDIDLFRESFRETIGRGREEVKIEIDITEQQYSKTNEQLRYWKGPLLEVAFMGYRGLGYKLSGKEDTEYLLKSAFWFKYVGKEEDSDMHRIPKSLKYISKEDFIALIDKARDFINDNLNVYLMTPEEYLEADIDKETGEIL